MPIASDPWNDWYDAHARALILLARQWGPTSSDAEDIVHDAFIRFWNRRNEVDDPAAFMFACVRRMAIDYVRSTQRRRTREQAVSAQRVDVGFFESPAVHDERRQHIEDALAELVIEQREVVVMKIWGGLTFPTIGEATGVSANTAASRYRYAMAALKQSLSEESV